MFVVPVERRKVNAGDRFGRLVVVGTPFYMDGRKQAVVTKCDCGNHAIAPIQSIKRGSKRSCGCLNSELSRERATTHGQHNTPLHKLWKGMKVRCKYPSHDKYHLYGGRGIRVCEEWLDFAVFHAWAMVNGYEPGLEIDRVDSNGNYEPSNCRFQTRMQQMQNTRNTVMVTAFSETKSISDWASDERCIVGRVCLAKRIRSGWEAEKALITESRTCAR